MGGSGCAILFLEGSFKSMSFLEALLNLNGCGESDKVVNSVSCDVRDGAPISIPEIGNVLVCDNNVSNAIDVAINIVSNLSKDSILNFVVVEASKPDLVLSGLPDVSITYADALVARDVQSLVLVGISALVGCNNLSDLNSVGGDAVLAINYSLNLRDSPSSGKDTEVLRDNSEELHLIVEPECNPLVVCDVALNGSSPPVQSDEFLVEVLVNLTSSNALVGHVGGRSGDSVRMQTDWLVLSSPSSSEAEEDVILP
ncbi:hypothetical protein MA16_Dca013774 [Dendrobium catenatum]|uniref:Uncharacterized protein n=1 Tax=Dendrobium catenatum TaxID=906689 RepID=A0A2I0VWF6_9ASPA|nr:hypothetical protein MA16_Dca013774 [Dendrobium catenatum]